MPNIHRTNRQFPGGAQIGAIDENIPSTAGSPVSNLSTDPDFFLPNTADPAHPLHYRFLFWNVCGTISSDVHHGNGTVPSSDTVATAWYVPVGNGDGVAFIVTYAFWVEHDSVVSDTPIQSVNPAAAWTGGNNTVVSSTVGSGPRVITARDTVPSITNANFDSWFLLGGGTASTSVLIVDQGGSTSALALYKHHDGGRIPNPADRDKTTKPGSITMADPSLIDRSKLEILPGHILIADPSPIDRSRLVDILTQTQSQTHPAVDRLTQVLKKEQSSISTEDLRGVAAELKANINRMQSAVDLINAGLKGK